MAGRSARPGLRPFQSAPGVKAGGNRSLQTSVDWNTEFQSAPGGEAGGKLDGHQTSDEFVPARFNPPPAVKAGGNFRASTSIASTSCFNPPPA